MARKQKPAEPEQRKLNLEPPFPAPPTRPTKYAVYCTYPADAEPGKKRLICLTFAAAYSAKKFIDEMIGDDYEWVEDPSSTFGHVVIGSNNVCVKIPGKDLLKEVLDHKFTRDEDEWELPESYVKQCFALRREWAPDSTTGDAPKEKKEKAPKPERQKINKTGMITISEIAEQMGIEPRDARQSMRKQKIAKPQGGWLFATDRVDEIKETIKKGLK